MYPPYAPTNTSSKYTGNMGEMATPFLPSLQEGVNSMMTSPGLFAAPSSQAGSNMQSPYETHPYLRQIYNSSNSASAQPLAGSCYPLKAGSSYPSSGATEPQHIPVAGAGNASGSAQWIGYGDGREGTVMTQYDVNTSQYNDNTPYVAKQQQGYDSTVSSQPSMLPDMGLSGAMSMSSPYNLASQDQHSRYAHCQQPIHGHAQSNFGDYATLNHPSQAGPVGSQGAHVDRLHPLCVPQVIHGVNHIFNSSNSEYAQPPASSSYPPTAGSSYLSSGATVGNFPSIPSWVQYTPMAGAGNVPYSAQGTGCGGYTTTPSAYALNPAVNMSHYNDNTPYILAQQGYNSMTWIHASMPAPDMGPSGAMQTTLKHNSASQWQLSGNAYSYCPEDCTVYAPGCQPAWAQKDSIYLDKVSIWERPVESLQAFYQDGQGKGRGRLGVHHYAVFRLACGHSFVVEKIAKPAYSEILECNHAKYTSGGPAANTRLRIIVDLKVANVSVRDFKNILKALGDKYKLLSDNCWSYSYGTVKEAIKLCQKAANLSSENRNSLQVELKRLKHVKRIMPQTVLNSTLLLAAAAIVI